jgi:hypothetical protein
MKMSISQALLPTTFPKSDKKVKSRMPSVPDKLLSVAMEVLERVRLGLDIPSRAEVFALAERMEALSSKIEKLEIGRQADSQLVAQLRDQAARAEALASSEKPAGSDEDVARTRVRKNPNNANKTSRAPAKKAPRPAKKNEASKTSTSPKPRRKPRAGKAPSKATGKASHSDDKA